MKYYKIAGGYYTGTQGNLKPVSSAATLKKLRSGALRATTKDSSFMTRGSASKSKDKKKQEDKTGYKAYDTSLLTNSAEYKRLGKDDQEAVLTVFQAIAGNDKAQAARLIKGFETAQKTNDPYFKQQLRLATDAIKRGYVAIDDEADYKESQIKNQLKDLREDYDSRKEYLTFEEANQMREIERAYKENLDVARTDMAARGFGSSSIRAKKEQLLEDTTGDLRESTTRRFGYEKDNARDTYVRGTRDNREELARLNEITKAGKLDFLRKAEEQVGTSNLPRLSGAPRALGDIYGDIPQQRLDDTLKAMTSFVF